MRRVFMCFTELCSCRRDFVGRDIVMVVMIVIVPFVAIFLPSAQLQAAITWTDWTRSISKVHMPNTRMIRSLNTFLLTAQAYFSPLGPRCFKCVMFSLPSRSTNSSRVTISVGYAGSTCPRPRSWTAAVWLGLRFAVKKSLVTTIVIHQLFLEILSHIK